MHSLWGKFCGASKFYEGRITLYPQSELYKEISFIAYYFHWDYNTIINFEHNMRRKWCVEISNINKQFNPQPKNIFDV